MAKTFKKLMFVSTIIVRSPYLYTYIPATNSALLLIMSLYVCSYGGKFLRSPVFTVFMVTLYPSLKLLHPKQLKHFPLNPGLEV